MPKPTIITAPPSSPSTSQQESPVGKRACAAESTAAAQSSPSFNRPSSAASAFVRLPPVADQQPSHNRESPVRGLRPSSSPSDRGKLWRAIARKNAGTVNAGTGNRSLSPAARSTQVFSSDTLQTGPKMDDPDDVLLAAARAGDASKVQAALEAGAAPEAVDPHGWTALLRAADSGHESIAALLLMQGANVNAGDHLGGTALMLAVAEGHFGLVHCLVRSAADVNAANRTGWRALHLAARRGDAHICRTLLDSGSAIDAVNGLGRTALMLAAENGHEELVRLLLARTPAADVTLQNHEGWDALMLAAESHHAEKAAVGAMLIEARADLAACNRNGWTALAHAARNGTPLDAQLVSLLIVHGASVHQANCSGFTPLVHASLQGSTEVVSLLVGAGAEMTPMVEAALHQAEETQVAEKGLRTGGAPDSRRRRK